MIIKRKINVFKVVNGRIEYTDLIKKAVLDHTITFKKLHMNGGWDWVDKKYSFIKLLIRRGQVLEVETHQDLLVTIEYLQDIKLGVMRSYSFSIKFNEEYKTKKCAYASSKRLENARARWVEFCNQTSKKVGA